jgi:hypothetical protein
MKRQNLITLLGATTLAVLLGLGTSTLAWAAGAEVAGEQATAYAVIDCSDVSTTADIDVPGAKDLGSSPQVGGTCRLAGSGPFSYCTGECRYSHYSCEQVVTSNGITCGCRIPIRQ